LKMEKPVAFFLLLAVSLFVITIIEDEPSASVVEPSSKRMSPNEDNTKGNLPGDIYQGKSVNITLVIEKVNFFNVMFIFIDYW
jgi:hypothetical protein